TAVAPKPLSANVQRGLGWLAEHQLQSGGWGQGDEAAGMRGSSGDALRDQPNVADTCVAALALIRSGSSPTAGPYKDAVARAVRFVVTQVEGSDSQSLSVSTVQGTRVQAKLGPNIDTFLASMLLAEVKGKMPAGEIKRVNLALDRVLEKIKRHQKDDGTFEGQGWAPILAQAMCGKGLNRARQAGAQVSGLVLARAENSARMGFAQSASPSSPVLGGEASGGSAGSGAARARAMSRPAPASAAGVNLYFDAANLGVLQDSVNTNRAQLPELRDKAAHAKDIKERDEAKRELSRIQVAEKANTEAQVTVIARLGDKQFTDGFGSNGGEEFLSYMNISESLVVKGGPEWKQWDDGITKNLNHVQNDDGSWSGHHCITGRTFCTSSALLVLMADRTPVPASTRPVEHSNNE
ncbi:MAG TPA: hypothetical protein VGY53_13510, partial [Isosphaeraceae bacterium]|nr:hypothetical protein [Isosphaeraceae bacterium]